MHEKSVPELNKKLCLKAELQKSKNTPNMTPKWNPKSEYILGEMPIWVPLVVQTVFVMKKLAPNVAKVLPRLEYCTSPDLWKNLRSCGKA